jgi:hypothetical protein
MITPVEDAACGETDKPAGGGQDLRKRIVKKKQESILNTYRSRIKKGL